MELRFPHFVAWDEIAERRGKAADFPAAGLWVAGSLAGLEARKCVAVVGTRAPSTGARRRAYEVGAALAGRSVCVISGLAHGIDAAAHEGVVAAGGSTIGVLGGGHRHFFPPRNERLARAMIAAGGAVVSPYDPDEPAMPFRFLQRNEIIAVLADLVIVVEAAARSGALNTAGWAGKHGVYCVAFPGDVERPAAAGCNALIRDGVTLVRDVNDVFEALGLENAAPCSNAEDIAAGYEARGDALAATIVRTLARESLDVDSLSERTGATAGELLSMLVRLEIGGVAGREGTHYTLTAEPRLPSRKRPAEWA